MRWYYGWNVIGVSLVMQALLTGFGIFSFTLWVSPWVATFDVSRGEIMIAIMLAVMGMGAFAPIVGWAMDRSSIRALICTGTAIFSTGLILISASTELWQIILIYGSLIPAGIALAGPTVGQTLAAKWFRERRGLALGIVATGTSIGGFLMPLVASELLIRVGWRDAYLYSALLVLGVIPLAWLIVRNSPEHMGLQAHADNPDLGSSNPERTENPWTTKSILQDRGFIVATIAFWVPGLITVGVLQNLGPYSEDFGFTPRQTAVLITVLSIVMIGGKILLGTLTDYWKIQTLYWISTTALALSLLILILEESYLAALVACGLLGFASGGFLPLMGAVIGDRFGRHAFGQAIGLLFAFFTLNAVGSVLTAWIRDTTGSYDVAFTIYLIVLLPAALVMLFLPPKDSGPLNGQETVG